MRLPLFVYLRAAKKNKLVPAELRHSGILSLDWLCRQNLPVWHFFDKPTDGVTAIDLMADRILKYRGFVRVQVVSALRERLAGRIYDSSSKVQVYARRHCAMRSGCFARADGRLNEDDGLARLYSGSKRLIFYRPTIGIAVAKWLPCRWCGCRVYYKESWKDYYGNVRCNGPDCRRIEYLQNKPQSLGGIDLTPRQRKSTPTQAWATIKVANYLALKAKEKRNGRKKHHHQR